MSSGATARVRRAPDRTTRPAPAPIAPLFRKLWPHEAEHFKAHLRRLDRSSRHLRFGASLGDASLERYVDGTWQRGAIIHGAFVDGTLRGVGELHFAREPWPLRAEVALSVEAPWQDRGIGKALLGRVVCAAQNRWVRDLTMICLAENLRMRHLARLYRARLRFEAGQVEGTLAPAYPTPASVLEEFAADLRGQVGAILAV